MGEHFYWIVTTCSGVMSIIGGLFIIYTYIAIPAIQNSTRQMLVCLTIADIATAIGNMIGAIRFVVKVPNVSNVSNSDVPNVTVSNSDDLCVAQSFVTTMSSLCSFVWTSLIALHLLLLVICNGNDTYQISKKIKILFHLLGWCLPGKLNHFTKHKNFAYSSTLNHLIH